MVLLGLLLVAGCSDNDDEGGGGSGNPAGPSPTPPPSGVVSVAGTWNGSSDFQQNGIRYISTVTASIRQTDRAIDGNITFTGSGYSGWTATFTGQLSGTSPASQFFGNVTVNAAPVSGGGTCTGQMTMSGETRTNTLRWESPNLNLAPSGSAAGSTVCMGNVLTIVWILSR
ncbi:MAG: hypothetical protein ACREMQ_19915 [Longimicrobiales bacterium]